VFADPIATVDTAMTDDALISEAGRRLVEVAPMPA
jgi:hypothetical protein